jgi:hypothetical protein
MSARDTFEPSTDVHSGAARGADRKMAAGGILAISMNRAAWSVGARRIRRQGRSNWIWRLPDDVASWLGHKNIQHTRYTDLAPGRFKDFWR